MSGYKRVNFYELCRLCASNQQKEKTHIFHEEGRKIQLQTKIQSCLSLTVCENDFLPKVVCAQCLQSLEECYYFRKECISSEKMLSSYFKNFRYTEDFKKSGKVYIKDTSSKASVHSEPVSSTTTTTNNLILNNVNYVQEVVKNGNEQIPVYTVQLPVAQNQQSEVKVKHDGQTQTKGAQNPSQVSFSINPVSLGAFKKPNLNETIGNIAVNANEVINFAQLVDFEHILAQPKQKLGRYGVKEPKIPDAVSKMPENEPNVVKINVAQPDASFNQFKLPTQKPNKFAYSIKLEDGKNCNVVLNQELMNHDQLYSNLNLITSNNVMTSTSTIMTSSNPPPIIPTADSDPEPLQIPPNIVCNAPTIAYPPKTPPKTPPQPQAIDSKTHTCDVCHKTFKRREHLYQHVKLHTGYRPFTCENCSKSFMRKEHLLRHMTSHSGQKNFTCDVCEKCFSRNDNLLKHRKTHEKQSSFTCEICQKQFIMKHYYLAHRVTHDQEKCAVGPAWGLLKV